MQGGMNPTDAAMPHNKTNLVPDIIYPLLDYTPVGLACPKRTDSGVRIFQLSRRRRLGILSTSISALAVYE